MKVLGNKAIEYADREDLYTEDGEFTKQTIINAFKAGFEEANKWEFFNPEIKLEDGLYLIIPEKNGIIELAMWNSYFKCWDDSEGDDFRYDWVYQYKKV